MTHEYKVVPAPIRGLKAPGAKTNEERFALALQTAINEAAADGWEYIRADTLPCEQREGLMSKTTVYQNMLVFRRAKPASGAPKMKAQRQTPPAPSVSAPAVSAPKVEKKITSAEDKPEAAE
ncbi:MULTISPECIES: DUF4177 domain-containing protein [unclassified Yoonia]|uniref:DUF4177 domain-containing protein n=1 Tax=unclassified Yoonia TaxID=2629118 RepID=UPI002AFF7DDD|nr:MULTISPECIES: DUF4177 domain-containing protein [unclassified Yoonia]